MVNSVRLLYTNRYRDLLSQRSSLTKYDEFKRFLDNEFEMPDGLVALLVQLPGQNNGILSKRFREKEYVNLANDEVQLIEQTWHTIFSHPAGQ